MTVDDLVGVDDASGAQRVWPGLLLVAAVVGAAEVLHRALPGVATLVLGVILGLVAANTGVVRAVHAAGIRVASRQILQVGVVLLGLRLSLGELWSIGGPGFAVVIVSVAVAFLGTLYVSRRVGVSGGLGILVATGFAICGASAIAAMQTVVEADEDEVAFSVLLVALFGSLAIFVLPLLGGALGDTAFGAWAGAGVHDVAQVVATAARRSPAAVDAAVVVKLTRVLLLVPLVLLVALRRRRSAPGASVTVPPFLTAFCFAVLASSTPVVPDAVERAGVELSGRLMTAGLVGLGCKVRLAEMRRLGARPLALGLVSWALIAAVSYTGVALTH